MTKALVRYCSALSKRIFGEPSCSDPRERILRLIEEAIELGQAEGVDKAVVSKITEFVYNKKKGYIPQEAGGVIVTLLLYLDARSFNLEETALGELGRLLWEDWEYLNHKKALKKDAGIGLY